jgi:hypothetical protein
MEVSWKQGNLKHPSLSKKKTSAQLYQSKCGYDFRISIGLLLIKLIKGVQNSCLFYSILLFYSKRNITSRFNGCIGRI